jgi:hypothetical protein
VEGDRVIPLFPEPNQDYVFVSEPVFPFKDARDYANAGMKTARALAIAPDPVLVAVSAALRAVQRVVPLPSKIAIFAEPNYHVLGQTFWTAAPLRYGKYIAKIRIAPSPSSSVAALADHTIGQGIGALTDAIVEYFRHNSAEYVVSAQLCTNEEDMSIEDATKPWSEEASPFRPIATISYPAQDAYSGQRRFFGDDQLTFNSWRAIEEHRPLGSINRLKLEVYEASSTFRHEKNRVERFEPRDATDVPQ